VLTSFCEKIIVELVLESWGFLIDDLELFGREGILSVLVDDLSMNIVKAKGHEGSIVFLPGCCREEAALDTVESVEARLASGAATRMLVARRAA
jgi:hypothetical protein